MNLFLLHRCRAGRSARLAVIPLLAILVFSPAVPVAAAPSPSPSVTLLKNGDYLDALVQGIRTARKSVLCSCYLFKTGTGRGNQPRRIADELIRARQRGVAVTVVLEDEGRRRDPLNGENHLTADLLRRGGVTVRFDSPWVTSHAKVVVIDNRHVYLGSHNLTQSALTRNNELSLHIDSPALAAEITGYLGRL
ncbi:phospholipase D-like domain-containing protein [Geomobilimonas luticola]|uniref:phospholipase D n=1 Tax=Geomobilimonas luticola TaxID=1114878 RepID=A0ABS5S8L0_9BACT|nr:phospholipase D-like domain-containing protein [Geomobilimonas luticola]MBT0651713.1 phospholipase [Geomobilimonas luticola]